MTTVLCDGLVASPDCTGSEGVLLPSPHSLGPSSPPVTELLKLTPGDWGLLSSVIGLASSLVFALFALGCFPFIGEANRARVCTCAWVHACVCVFSCWLITDHYYCSDRQIRNCRDILTPHHSCTFIFLPAWVCQIKCSWQSTVKLLAFLIMNEHVLFEHTLVMYKRDDLFNCFTVEPHLSGRRSSRRLGLPGRCYSKPAILLRTLMSRLPRT